ncbi:endonuclease [Caerostris extrusa]|uniref:Endonuclease n=1 Tax=Caerostris extrusa TaxID=172846 RepID=A0AAV4YDN7_CAEEX|nr:endonuclease [Caerostris extrusa]
MKNNEMKVRQVCYKFDIVYRPSKSNIFVDILSRIIGSTTLGKSLGDIHADLYPLSITRMHHWVRSKNFTFSLEDIKKSHQLMLYLHEQKARFLKNDGKLIKATSPFPTNLTDQIGTYLNKEPCLVLKNMNLESWKPTRITPMLAIKWPGDKHLNQAFGFCELNILVQRLKKSVIYRIGKSY